MSEAYLEIVVLKCPKCGALMAEPSWFLDLEQEITCSSCKICFQAKGTEVDRKMLRILVENDHIKDVVVTG